MRIRPNNFLSIELQNQPKHAVGSWMLRSKIHSVVTDLSVVAGIRFKFRRLPMATGSVILSFWGKCGICGNESSSLIRGFGVMARD
jgi:hypothetical protein